MVRVGRSCKQVLGGVFYQALEDQSGINNSFYTYKVKPDNRLYAVHVHI